MKKSFLGMAFVLLAGFAVAAYVIVSPKTEPTVVSQLDPGDFFDQSAATEDRLQALEAAVSEERNARQLLEEELQALYEEIERLSDGNEGTEEESVAAVQSTREFVEERRRQFRGANTSESRESRLIEAGFSPGRADWITRRESELRMEAMQAQYDARRSGEPLDRSDPQMNPDAALRAEIGDAEYTQYLQANNRRTSVVIGSVFESSPGQTAGLQSGDEIVAYAGQRVFDTSDLNQQTMQGEPGQSVVVDIVRDGIPMQLVMPRGPIGVSTGRGLGRRW
jgi:predicted metalloprotease with PDZ domain